MKGALRRSLPLLLLGSILFLLPATVNSSPIASGPRPDKGAISRITAIAAHASSFGTVLNILGNGEIPAYVTRTIDSPPKIAVDILCRADSLETLHVAVESSELKGLRVGHHSQKIRMVLDINGAEVPHFAIDTGDDEMTIFLGSEKIKRQMEDDLNDAPPPESDIAVAEVDRTDGIKTDENRTQSEIVDDKGPTLDDFVPAAVEAQVGEVGSAAKRSGYIGQIRKTSARTALQADGYANGLFQTVSDDGREDTAFFIESLNAYEARDWSSAVDHLTHIIETYPKSKYLERAYFLLAKAYEKRYSASISDHFNEIKNHYEDAIYKFVDSEYIPEALLGIGNLCFRNENYYEAVGYYNLILKKDKRSILAARALIQKTKIMLLMKRKDQALLVSAILDEVVSDLPERPEKTEAKYLRARILYEMNQYQESMEILSKIKATNPGSIYRYPEIFLYLGYNLYQMEDNAKAREYLLRFYNSCPDQEKNHLTLTQIGDTYRNEGSIEDAVKFYQLVLDRYPGTEGAVISKIRLAEQQEEGRLKADDGLVPSVNLIGQEIAAAKETYEEIIRNAGNIEEKKPLAQLALLKLAVLYQKEEKYKKSLEYLRLLFTKYPPKSLPKEGLYALELAIDGFFKQEMKAARYANVINLYLNEKQLFEMVTAPELFLAVGRAFTNVNLEDMGTELFKKADPLLSDQEKPADLLFFLGRHLYKQEKLEGALAKLDLLLENHPNNKYTLNAYRLKGRILLQQKRFPLAAENFSAALRYPLTRCEKLNILIAKAGALSKSSFTKEALEVVREADGLKRACSASDHGIYQEIGDLYFHLGYAQEAAAVFRQAAEMANEQADKIALMLKVAECYRLLDQREAFLALNEQISNLDDPFWSNLAKERMEEINFNWEMKRTKTEWKRGEKI